MLVSALYFGGGAEKALRHIAANHELIVSDYIVDELIAFAKATMPKTPQRTIRLLRQTLETYVRSHEAHEVEIRDINDVEILQLAIEYSAILVTSDKDLLEYSAGATPPVLSLNEYEELFLR